MASSTYVPATVVCDLYADILGLMARVAHEAFFTHSLLQVHRQDGNGQF
jgi:hypothetical protein